MTIAMCNVFLVQACLWGKGTDACATRGSRSLCAASVDLRKVQLWDLAGMVHAVASKCKRLGEGELIETVRGMRDGLQHQAFVAIR